MLHKKSQNEIERLRKSADLVGRTLAEVAKYIKAGTRTQELDAIAEDYIRSHDAEPAFKGYQVGDRSYPASLCVSVNSAVVHGIPGDYALQEGDIVSVDCGVKLAGYYGDFAYTFAVGRLSPENANLLRVTHESLYKGIAQAVVGNRTGDIAHAVQSHCEAHGYGVVRDLVGHGIGKEMHEEPQVPNFGRRGTGKKLKDGLTLCIEPMINRGTHRVIVDKDGWTIRSADDSPSAHYEHMIVVRRGKAEILSTFDYIEDVIDAPFGEEVIHGEAAGHQAGR